jgi:dTDP-glucose pyrophosphorylase
MTQSDNTETKPTLLVLAAGMGSRYGGLKQLDPVGPNGETIMDYSIYDAMRAGFGKVVFVIRHDFEQDFDRLILSKYRDHIDTAVAFQAVDDLPEGFTVPEGRTRPWGTNHAIMAARHVIDTPFAVINADDFYGRDAFEVMAGELRKMTGKTGEYCMVGFKVGNTMTDHGSVSRGVCTVVDGVLDTVVERKKIYFDDARNVVFVNENGEEQHLDESTPVSMNLWGFTPDYFNYSKREFDRFLTKYINVDKSEFYIPSVVDRLIRNGEAHVNVLRTNSRWFGVTYAEDRPKVVAELAALHEAGEYPSPLFS